MCKSDGVPVCSKCLSQEHQLHPFQDLGEATEQLRSEVHRMLQEQQHYEQMLAEWQQKRQQTQTQFQAAVEFVFKNFNALLEVLI